MVLARNASKCMIGFEPSRHLPSNTTANLNTEGLISSATADLLDFVARNSLHRFWKITSAVIPFVSNSYSFARISFNYDGDCSWHTSPAISCIKPSKSGLGTLVLPLNELFLTRMVCRIMIARLKFLREWFAIESAKLGGSSKFSRFDILHKMLQISLSLGAGTLTCKQRDLRGRMTLLRLSQLAIIRHEGMNVSMVRLRDACAV